MTLLSYAAQGFVEMEPRAAYEAVAAAGFENVEVMGNDPLMLEAPTGKGVSDFCDMLSDCGLTATSIHGPFTRPGRTLADPIEERRREDVAAFAAYVRFCGAAGIPAIAIHATTPLLLWQHYAGGASASSEDESAQLARLMADALRRSLDELVPIAAACNTRLLLENLAYEPAYPLCYLGGLRPVIDAYPAEQVGLVIDTGHAVLLGADPVAEIHAGGTRIGGTQLSDVPDGTRFDHRIPGQGDLDWDGVFAALVTEGYDGALTFEVSGGVNDETPEETARLTREFARQRGW